MKLALHDNSMETNVKVKSHSFKIGNAGKIIGILRGKLYEHKIRTLVQEYISNARDAMRESKSNKRIVITVPNSANPVFKVRDFFGITPERMEDVFINYGSSTKEETNEQAGGFGIGSKSAWAYTDAFTVVSITGGMKRTYVCEIGSNKEGMLNELSCEPTTEENGTEVHVAVKHGDIQNFRNAIYRAVYFWRGEEYPEFKGVVAHEVPKRSPSIRIGDLEVSKDLPNYLELDQNSYHNYISMVIDGIPYKMGQQFIAGIKPLMSLLKEIKCQAVIHIGNGMLDIPATRESVSTEEINKEILGKLAPKLQEGLAKHIKAEFAKAKTYSEWITTYVELSEMFEVDEYAKRGDYSIKGETVRSNTFNEFNMFEAGPGPRKGFRREPVAEIELEQLDRIFYIDDPDEPMVTQNRRIKEFQQRTGKKTVILVQAAEQSVMEVVKTALIPIVQQPSKVVPGTTIAAPMTVKKVLTTLAESEKALTKFLKDLGGEALSTLPYTAPIRAPRALRVKEKEEFTLHRFRFGKKNPLTTTLENVESKDAKYLYIDFKDWNKHVVEFGKMNNFIEGRGWMLCAMTPKAIKQVKGHKNFKPYEAWMAAFVPSATLIASICNKRAKNNVLMGFLAKASTKIADPVLAGMVDCYETILKTNPEDVPEKILKLVSNEIEAFEKDDAELTKLIKAKYILLNRMSAPVDSSIANELVSYINSKV